MTCRRWIFRPCLSCASSPAVQADGPEPDSCGTRQDLAMDIFWSSTGRLDLVRRRTCHSTAVVHDFNSFRRNSTSRSPYSLMDGPRCLSWLRRSSLAPCSRTKWYGRYVCPLHWPSSTYSLLGKQFALLIHQVQAPEDVAPSPAPAPAPTPTPTIAVPPNASEPTAPINAAAAPPAPPAPRRPSFVRAVWDHLRIDSQVRTCKSLLCFVAR